MVILITGSTHTGKTLLAQKLLKKYQFSYLSIDHIKMGLIRSGYTNLKTDEDEKLIVYLWPIIREIIKTNIENEQNIIIEGCYIPYDWKKDFDEEYLKNIKYYSLIMSERYIKEKYSDILKYESVIEKRKDTEGIEIDKLIRENNLNLEMCKKYQNSYILIEDDYNVDIDLQVRSCIVLMDKEVLLKCIDKIHTTPLGAERIKKNLKITSDVIEYCKRIIRDEKCTIYKKGKNFYCVNDICKLTVNCNSFAIITAHIIKS